MAGIWSFRLNLVKNFCFNYCSRKLVLFSFRGDNARVFERVSMNLNMTLGQAACQLLCRYTQNTLAAPCVCWIVPIVTCDSWLLMFERHLVSGITDGAGVRTAPLAKLNVKTGPLPSLYFGIYHSFVFSRLLFFAFFWVFSGDFGFLCSRSTPDLLLFLFFSSIFWVLASGLHSTKFPPGSNL